jgi:hypothetical protein
MGKAYCGSAAYDKVENYVCGRPKLSVVTPHLVEKDTGLDHNQASACLDSISPHPGQTSTDELCEETSPRWLIKSVVNPNEYWIDETEFCMVNAIRTADASRLPTPEKEKKAVVLFEQCQSQWKNERLVFGFAAVSGGVLAADGFKRISRGEKIGGPELGFGLGLLIASIAIVVSAS